MTASVPSAAASSSRGTAHRSAAHALTADGWRIAIHRFAPIGPVEAARQGSIEAARQGSIEAARQGSPIEAARQGSPIEAARQGSPITRKHPVILCHGLASNHLGFDVDAEVSLARHLARRGYLTLAVDLRGGGDSERPSLAGARSFGWSFDDYLHYDVPAAIAYAKNATGATAVHWIGHSMGGILGYAHLACGGSGDFRSLTAIGSSLDYTGTPSGFHSLVPFRSLLDRVPLVPLGILGQITGPLVGRVHTPFERFNVWPSNTDPELWRRLTRSGFHAVSPPVMAQLATAMLPGGLRSRDGSIRYTEGLATATAPVLAIAGDRDPQCPPEAAARTLEALGSTRRELAVFGPEHGHADHYAHFDLLMGLRAPREVFGHIDRWLDEHDDDAVAANAAATA